MTHAYVTTCPHCGRLNDCTSAVLPVGTYKGREPTPTDGTISFCVSCHGFAIFSFMTPGGLRLPSEQEQRDIEASPIGRDIIEVAAKARR